MNSYIAKDSDTLRSIAKKLRLDLDLLMAANPQILNPDHDITGQKVKLRPPINIPICKPLAPSTDQKHWIPLTSLEKMAKNEYDVIIVGTGAGGPATLWRLCEQWKREEKRIGIIERGDLLTSTHALNVPTMNATRKTDLYKNIGYSLGKYFTHFPGATEVFALGGRTLFWSGNSPRLHPIDMAKGPVTYKELLPYYNIAERVMNVTKEYTKDSMITTKMLEILRSSGFPDAMEMPMAVDLSGTKFGQVHSDAFFSAISFLAMALNQRPFDLAVRARAVEIYRENERATGIRVMSPEKKSYVIKAKNIVLSASTWETPRLLLNSGIKERSIGHYLMNHSKVVATPKVNRDDFPEMLGTLATLIPRKKKRPYQITVYGPELERYMWYSAYEEKPVLKDFKIGIEALGIVEPRFENHISLDPNRVDAYGVPEIKVHFSYSEKDMEIIIKMMNGVNHVISGIGESMTIKNEKSDLCLWVPGDDYHEMGTCRMGNDPLTSVTNRYGQIHRIPNLYVADNSVLPFSGAANPTLTTISLAIRTADYIINQLR
ncbi:GMC oxidoreductase [Alteribacillus bidgolensis]|uniref:Choline dehydrogenase n=1 Tax=Alteribacillus bidgolensis TaxID=930129 RepID=A0A1G8EBK3_9BACI|nr:GMC family oxidoreductase [Alteribacillus bidgolensis]SDH67312.1 Choline dehydrogenase [Alteribacillus bidgolensis]